MITIPADSCPRCGTILLIRGFGEITPEEELAKVLNHVCATPTAPGSVDG